MNIIKNIERLTIPYKDIYTTVYTVKTDDGVLIFDSASYPEDIGNYILPFLDDVGITSDMIKYVFVSHPHGDHAGGLAALVEKFPNISVIAGGTQLKERFPDFDVVIPKDGDEILGVLKLITIPGHTADSIALYDTRTKTLISGDGLQLYGIFGSGEWGANIGFPKEHIKAIEKLRNIDIEYILTAHDYHPYGYFYCGQEAVERALDACAEPLCYIRDLIEANPGLTDEEIREIYNDADKPTLNRRVVPAIRAMKV